MEPNCNKCAYRHENGNCTAVGGFCTAVPATHCQLLMEYLDTGFTPDEHYIQSCAEKSRKFAEDSLEILRQINQKVSAADVVEVVRCEKCLYYRHAGELRDYGLCSHPMYNNIHTFSDCIQKNKRDFCSYGKKRIPTPGTSCHPLPGERAWEE